MSGIYIPGMEMPTACCSCPCNYDNVCAIANKYPTFEEWHKNKPSWCPLIAVPNHGRLIDGDVAEVISFIDTDARDGDFADGILYAADWIAKLPTIIPADPEVHDCDNCKWFGGLMCDHVDENYKCLGWERYEK